MRENENQRLIPEVYGAALEREDAAWTSSDERILKVDNGYLYPVSVGEAAVTAEIRGRRPPLYGFLPGHCRGQHR